MIINRPGAGFEYGGARYVVGGPVIATDESEYKGLYGCITEIRDGEDKETDNDTPDLYCEFDPPTLLDDVKRLEDAFSVLYGMQKTLDEITLDLVIMAPEMIRPLERARQG